MQIKSLGALLIVAALAGCSALPDGVKNIGAYETGTQISQTDMDKIVVNQSTMHTVTKLFGQPNRKERDGNTLVWYYDYSKISHFGNHANEATVFEINATSGKVTNKYKTGKAAAQSSNPLLKAAGQ